MIAWQCELKWDEKLIVADVGGTRSFSRCFVVVLKVRVSPVFLILTPNVRTRKRQHLSKIRVNLRVNTYQSFSPRISKPQIIPFIITSIG